MSKENLLTELIASKLKKLLNLKNISSLDLSNATGVNASKISRVLTQKGNLSISELLNISKYFNVGVDYFLNIDTDLDIKYMPVIKISDTSNGKECFIVEKDSDLDNNAIGIYIQEENSSILLSQDTIVIVNILNSNISSRPIIFIHNKIYHIGISQNNKIINVGNGDIHNYDEIIIIGEILKQKIQIQNLIKKNTSFMRAFIQKIDVNMVKNDYLYKLFCES